MIHLNKNQEKDPKWFKDAKTGVELDVIDNKPLTEWLCENYKNYGAQIEFITDKSQEGFQFCNGFGGIGGFLRYKLDQEDLAHMNNDDEEDNNDDFDPDEDFI